MTDNPDTRLLSLADRCEAAKGLDRELDIAIALALPSWTYGGKQGRFFNAGPYYEGAADRIGFRSDDGSSESLPGNAPDMMVPQFTASLDAAMTLVPEGWWVQHVGHCLNGWRARVERNVLRHTEDKSAGFGPNAPPIKTAALALCAAALRARGSHD